MCRKALQFLMCHKSVACVVGQVFCLKLFSEKHIKLCTNVVIFNFLAVCIHHISSERFLCWDFWNLENSGKGISKFPDIMEALNAYLHLAFQKFNQKAKEMASQNSSRAKDYLHSPQMTYLVLFTCQTKVRYTANHITLPRFI